MRGLNHRGRPGGQRRQSWQSKEIPPESKSDGYSQDQHWKTYDDEVPDEDDVEVTCTRTVKPSTEQEKNWHQHLNTKENNDKQPAEESNTTTEKMDPYVQDLTITPSSVEEDAPTPKNEEDRGGEEEEREEKTTPESDDIPPKTRSKPVKSNIQLFPDLPSVTEEAEGTFETLLECTYLNKAIGNSGQDEAMTCDCKQDFVNGVNLACGDDSDCINRLTSIECINERCGCGEDCKNQRFQKRQYAKVDVIRTDKKGYGLRALEPIQQGTFVYEYIGEVVSEVKFHKRAKYYEDSGFKHFYFMMLQKGEFIDATAKGCLARFCNHSCNPNCYVDKWVVGDKLKMGIFTKRSIAAGEEITFDYNVDRYGSEAQPCYCGEANCIGVLGGKTQTEAVSKLPQLLVEALELDGSDEDHWMATTKRKRKKKTEEELDEDYGDSLPTKPITVSSVSKVMSSLLQCREEWLIAKLVARISSTTDNAIHARVMQMHGYQIFSSLLRDWKSSKGIVIQILHILTQWPKLTKNKISSSKIESTVQELAEDSEFDEVKELAKGLMAEWSNLKMAYRIPRRERVKTEEEPTPANSSTNGSDHSANNSHRGTPTYSNGGSTGKKDKKSLNGRSNTNTTNNYNNEHHHDDENSNPSNNFTTNTKYSKRFNNEGIPAGPASKRKSNTNGPSANNSNALPSILKSLPSGWEVARAPSGRIYYFNRSLNITQWDVPKDTSQPVAQYDDENPEAATAPASTTAANTHQNAIAAAEEVARAASAAAAVVGLSPVLIQRTTQELTLQKIIEEASRIQEAQRKALQAQENEKEEQRLRREKSKEERSLEKRKQAQNHSSDKHSNGHTKSKERSQDSDDPEKLLTRTFAKYVPNIVARYESTLGHENVKLYSKEIVQILVQKEMRPDHHHVSETGELSVEKKAKVKTFVKSYMAKVVAKYKARKEAKSQQRQESSSSSALRKKRHSGGSSEASVPNSESSSKTTPNQTSQKITPRPSGSSSIGKKRGRGEDEPENSDEVESSQTQMKKINLDGNDGGSGDPRVGVNASEVGANNSSKESQNSSQNHNSVNEDAEINFDD